MQVDFKHACQKSWQIGPENEDISESVNSIDSGAIFPSRLGRDLSRNVLVVSVYALYKKLYVGIGFFMTPKSRDFSEKCSLQAICSIWAALPGAQHLERCFAPKDVFHMTRRAFLALRVIQAQGQFRSNMLVKNLGR